MPATSRMHHPAARTKSPAEIDATIKPRPVCDRTWCHRLGNHRSTITLARTVCESIAFRGISKRVKQATVGSRPSRSVFEQRWNARVDEKTASKAKIAAAVAPASAICLICSSRTSAKDPFNRPNAPNPPVIVYALAGLVDGVDKTSAEAKIALRTPCQ